MAAGTVTTTEERLGNVHKITFAWTSGTGAEGGTASGATTYPYTGLVLRVVTVPDGSDAPTDNYDITLTDAAGVDIANAQLANRDEANTEWVLTSMGAVVGDAITINVTNAGDAKAGTCIVYIGITPEQTDQVTDLEAAVYGASGITTYPAAAAAGNGVSIAEVIRYIQATQLGTIANTGGTATVGGILGDVANVSLATRLTNLAYQSARTPTAKSIASITSANLFTISTGPVRVLSIVGQITTGIEAAGNLIKLTHTPTGGSAVDLSGTIEANGAAVRKVLALNGVKATALQLSTDEGVVTLANQSGMPIVLTPGTIALNCAGTTTGAVTWYIEYEPMVPAATVAAA